ncbi:MAG: Lrp/AsnC family transcriptional regulator [Candidatus Diapherotrites archaeon]|nr:Lrp/AsnC family transcriptional regulator [Candidatus Diapherotrites archaeon]
MAKNADAEIVNLMLKEPSLSQKEIAKKLKISPPAVTNRIKKMKAEGLIEGFPPLLNMLKFGYDTTVLVMVRVKDGKLIDAAKWLSADSNVCAVYRITGVYDIAVIAKFRNTRELNDWNMRALANSDLIDRMNTSLVFDALKEGAIPNKLC